MNKLYLSLALHNHQPIGNYDFVIEDAYHKTYEPMITALERHPGVRLALHYSGPLRDWLAQYQPDFLKRVRTLAGRRQVELMTGGYYEPVLTALPDADKLGQIAKMNEAVLKDFGAEPIGMWLAERVWEPHLPRPLHEAGIRYTILDDTHFKYGGYTDDDLFGYYVTEEQGHPVSVFASLQYLRYAAPWSPVSEIIAWLRQQAVRPVRAGDPTRVVVMGDDGEKFGLWPTTYEHCWTNGWVEEFFSALEQNADWLITCPPGDVMQQVAPLGRAYVPAASYEEMNVWSLPAEPSHALTKLTKQLKTDNRLDILRFVKGGMWRYFMVKYPEINALHKRMLWASAAVHRMKRVGARSTALDHVWAGQCSSPYWHGVFGGIYLFHIREANYAHLIEAQTQAEQAAHTTEEWLSVDSVDIDCDTRPEIIVSTEAQWLLLDTPIGGTLIEWDWRARNLNLVNTLSRWREGYHQDLIDAAANGSLIVAGQRTKLESIQFAATRAKEPELEKKLLVDWYRRASLVDHVFGPAETLDKFYRSQYAEWGDFVNQPYQARITRAARKATITLEREGGVWIDGLRHPLHVEKKLVVETGESAFDVFYTVTNTGEKKIVARFGMETNWGISGGDEAEGSYTLFAGGMLHRLNAIEATPQAKDVAVVVERVGRSLIRASEPADWWQFPLETISLSEAGFERNYQGTTLMAHWPLELEAGAAWKCKLHFELVKSAK
jgi:4-alpha-glucanotransferase